MTSPEKPLALALLTLACSCATAAPAPAPAAAPLAGPSAPGPKLPYSPSLDPRSLDRAADPCADLFQFSCGGWVKANPIPPDQSSWSVYSKMQDDNRALLRALLEKAGGGGPARGPNEQKIGDYYAACMDEARIDAAGAKPIAAQLEAIDKIGNLDDGNTGGTIGHELTHGFDDEGRKFDSKGNLRDWWTEADGKEFEQRAGCVSDQYSRYPAVDEVKVNGKLTLGEDLADLGGLILAFRAWQKEALGKTLAAVDGLSPAQRFFVGYAQSWCGSTRPETARARALTDPHSPGVHRTNGVVANMPEFAEAFGCKQGAPLKKEVVCKVW